MDVIRQSYGIKVYDNENRILAQGVKLDSMLLLLEVYRGRSSFDREKTEKILNDSIRRGLNNNGPNYRNIEPKVFVKN